MITLTGVEVTFLIVTIVAVGIAISPFFTARSAKNSEKKRLQEEEGNRFREERKEYNKRIWEAKQASSIAYFQSRCETFERLYIGKDAMEPTEAQTNQYMADKAKLAEVKASTNELFKHIWNKYDD